MMQNFVTIFPTAQNVHLIKDVGQIGNGIAQQNSYSAKLVCYQNTTDYSYLKTEAKNISLDFIEPSGRLFFLEKAVLKYIKNNAKYIDVLNLYHLTKESVYYGLYYLLCNKKGKVYLKMDVYNEALTKKVIYSKNGLFQKFHQIMERWFFKKLTLVSVENPIALELIKQQYPVLQQKAILVTNGVNDVFLDENFPTVKSFDEKENIILSVGRIGAKDKNFEMLLTAFSKATLPNWKLIFVGAVANGFDAKVEELVLEHPHLKDQIILTGNIENRKELYEYYNRSKICCLTSPFESFGITFIEAMYFGNYVIGTKGMSSFNYITNNLQLGASVDANDANALVELLERVTADENMLKTNYVKAQQRVKETFCWSGIITPLLQKLNTQKN